jgi:pre-mRNA-splicing factor ATP-dependent RNA helicase DHX15/PRP43
MSSPTAGKKSKKERKSKFEDAVAEEENEKSMLQDDSIAVSTSKKRRGFESRFTAESDEVETGEPTKKIKVTMNPYTNRAYSKRYYEILKGREQLPAWEAKKHLLKLLDENQVIVLQGETGSGKTT